VSKQRLDGIQFFAPIGAMQCFQGLFDLSNLCQDEVGGCIPRVLYFHRLKIVRTISTKVTSRVKIHSR
jgi:hypothetical protein